MRRLVNAIRAFLETLGGAPYFDLDSQDRVSAQEWAALMVLHAEAIHDCTHTDQARPDLGMVGPRGQAAG